MTYDSLSMGRALGILRQVWSRKFPLDEERMQAVLFGKACQGISLDCVIQAAEDWTVSNKYAPTPSELAEIARRIHQQRYPHIRLGPSRQIEAAPEVAEQRQMVDQQKLALDQRAQWVWRKLDGDSKAVAQFWALAWKDAPDDETRHAIRIGAVDKPYLALVLTSFRNGARAA